MSFFVSFIRVVPFRHDFVVCVSLGNAQGQGLVMLCGVKALPPLVPPGRWEDAPGEGHCTHTLRQAEQRLLVQDALEAAVEPAGLIPPEQGPQLLLGRDGEAGGADAVAQVAHRHRLPVDGGGAGAAPISLLGRVEWEFYRVCL